MQAATAATAETVAQTRLTVAEEAATVVAEEQAVAQTAVAVSATTASTAMRVFSTVLKLSGIGLIIAAIALLIINFSKITEALGFATAAQKLYTETLEDFNKGAATAIEQVEKVAAAFQEAKDGVLSKNDALKVYNDTLGDTLGKANSLQEAEDLYTRKAKAYIEIQGFKSPGERLVCKKR